MAQKDKQVYPMPESNYNQTKHDEEADSEQSKELKRIKRKKCLAYIIAFAIFQTGVILLFSLTVMKIKNPKFRVQSATFETFDFQTSNPSFNTRMIAEIGVKNTNFGHYKYENTTITFFYRGAPIGSTIVTKARAKARSTKMFNVVVDLNSANLQSNFELGSDLNSGFLQLSSQSRLQGKVELFKVMKKKKFSEMDCTMEINLSARELQNVKCK